MSSFLQNKAVWFAVFGLIFMLSLDFWRWGEKIALSAFGLPGWIYYFFWLQIFLAAVIIIYIKYYWSRANISAGSDRS